MRINWTKAKSAVLLAVAAILSLAALGGSRADASVSTWETVGNASFTTGQTLYTSLSVYNGVPYVAYQDGGTVNRASVKKFDGSNWVYVGNAGFSAGQAYYTSLYIDQGILYVAYQDRSNSEKATVMKYNGSSWVTVGSPGFSAGKADYVSLSVYNGTPYVAYVDRGNSSMANVMKYNGSAWVTVGNANFSAGAVEYISLSIDRGTPYVAYSNNSGLYQATVMKFDGSSWSAVGEAGVTAGSASYLSLYVDQGTPYLSFMDGTNNNRITVMQFNGSRWEIVGNAGMSLGFSSYSSMYVYDGIPYVAYTDYGDNERPVVKKFNGTSWEPASPSGVTTPRGSAHNSLFIYNGTPYIAYMDGTLKATVKKLSTKYNVIYDSNGSTGGTVPADSTPYDNGATAPVLGNAGNLARTGYTFAGWNTKVDGSGTSYAAADTFTIGAADVTLYAKWTVNSYAVSYDGNGSTGGSAPAGSSYVYNTNVTAAGSGDLVKTGHTFAGWNTKPDGSGTSYAAADTFTIGAANVTLYAKWTVNRYAVAYDGNGSEGGSAPLSGSHLYNTSITLPGNTGNLTRTGYTFAGWNTKADGSGMNYASAGTFTIGAADVTLYAKWTLNSYAVSYNGNGSTGGSAPAGNSYVYNSSVTVAGRGGLVKTGHTFAGWNTKADGSGTSYAAEDTFTIGAADITLYAKWTVNSYAVAYDGNGSTGGSAPAGNSYVYNTSVTVAESGDLVKTGHTFAGWNTKPDGSGTSYAAADTFTIGAADVTLYAKWTVNRYAVAYDGNGSAGGSAPASGSHLYNTSITLPGNTGNLTRTGYAFAGWNTKADGSGTNYAAAGSFTIGAADVTLYAKWTLNSYAVSYDGNGSTGGSAPAGSSYAYNTSVTIADSGELVKTGHTFAGWNTKADGSGTSYAAADTFTIGAADITLYAKWTVNSYAVAYDGNGSTGGSAPAGNSYVYNSSVTVAGSGGLVKTGHTFAGWNTKPDGSGTSYAAADTLAIGAADVTLYAKWTINSYAVTYDGNNNTGGDVPTASSYDYNTSATVLGNTGSLVKTGHTFAGWNTAADGSGTNYAPADRFTMGASDVTLYAQWEANRYTVSYESSGGSTVNSQTVSYGRMATQPAAPVKSGHTFAGWYTDSEFNSPFAFTTAVTDDLTLYAKWTLNRYTVSFDSKGGSAVNSETVNYDSTASQPTDPVKTGYTFDGWYTDIDFNIPFAFTTTITDDKMLYAKWVLNRYTVAYDGNGSTSGRVPGESKSYDYNAEVTVLGNTGSLVKPGYVFTGWNTAADGSGTNYGAGDTLTMGASDIGLYARWLSSNALLSDLSVDRGILSPSFSLSTLNYTVDVDYAVTDLTLSFQKAEEIQAVSVTGAVYRSVTNAVYAYEVSNLLEGSNPIQIRVAAQDGTANLYAVTVNRAPEPSGNANLSELTLSGGSLTPVFLPGTTSYNAHVANEVSSITLVVSASHRNARITINGNAVIGGRPSSPISLNVGSNPIYIVVTAENGTTQTYSVDVDRASRGADDGGTGGGGGGGSTPPTPVTPSSPADIPLTSTDGQLTLPPGKPGEVSLGDAVKVSIPAGAASSELKVTIDNVPNPYNLVPKGVVLASPVYEILKNYPGDFSKAVTITLAFDPASLKKDQHASIFYYDEGKKKWVEAGGKVTGKTISVEVDHLAKYAVFAAGSTEEVPANPIELTDVAGHWAAAAIQQAVSAGIVTGYPNGSFKPNATVTRAEFAVMLMNALKPQAEGAALNFADKAKIGVWAQKAVAQAVEAGIIHGYQDGSFRPNAEMTRAEMASMVASALHLNAETVSATGFADDKKIPSWARGPVAALKELGIVNGKGANEFAPDGQTTRAEAVTVLLNMMAKSGN